MSVLYPSHFERSRIAYALPYTSFFIFKKWVDKFFAVCYNYSTMDDTDAIKIDANELLALLRTKFPDAKCELNYSTPFELLVAVILSAQCTDKRVNAVTPALFAFCSTPFEMAKLTENDIIPYIKSCGFYNNKAKSIIACSKVLVEKYGGVVPSDRNELQKLAGVGRKTANVVYAEAFGGNAIAVDTHVSRVSERLGLSSVRTPEIVEKELNAFLPYENWSEAHHLLIFLGRYVCKAMKPNCGECNLTRVCKYYRTKSK